MRLKWRGWWATRAQFAFWGSLAALTGLLLWAARAYPHWPWFSVWVLILLTGVGVFSIPRVRQMLAISWFGVTLLTLTGVSLANVFLYYVESHRQRSERLEVRGVYHDQGTAPLRVGVGLPNLDVVLEGDPVRFERWGVDIEAAAGDTFLVRDAQDVESLRVKRGSEWGFPRAGRVESVLGRPLTTRAPLWLASGTDSTALQLARGSRRGLVRWGGSEADLSVSDPLLDRTFGRRLRQGVQLAELAWDSLPELGEGSDDLLTQLVLTETKPGRRLGRFNLALPRYRVVSRSHPNVDERTVRVLPGDTLWVRSRGNSWAFSLGRVPAVSRIAAPTAVLFVRRPRPTGWALPSAEACGSEANRCAIISSERLPPPQAHFDLAGFGLDPERYAFLARLETAPDNVSIVSAHDRVGFDYGVVKPIPALGVDPDAGDAGYLMRVHKSDTSSRAAVLFTILGLYGLLLSALLTLLGNPFLARRLRTETASTSAAWALLNLFIVFLGVRLVLGLRVAYAAPFYDRAADTSVGLWITFAIMLVLLGRWDAWIPTVWRSVARIRQPVRRLLLRSGLSRDGATGQASEWAEPDSGTPELSGTEAAKRGRSLAMFGSVGLILSLVGLVWQRPTAGLGVVVALVGLGAWVTLGLFGASRAVSDRRQKGLSLRPVDVLTADFLSARPSRAFTVAAGVAIVLALAIQAPIVALGPVSGGLALFALAAVFERSNRFPSPAARAWALYAVLVSAAALGLWVFVGFGAVPVGSWAAGASLGGLFLRRRTRADNGGSRSSILLVAYQTLLDIGRSIFSGVAWMFVVAGLGALAFLSFQQIPPFVRFALVFMLFLLAVRTGLVCRRVLDNNAPRAHLTALGLLVIPLGVLLVFMLFDFGLGLVFFAPMMVTVLLAAEVDRLPRTLAAASAGVLVLVSLAAWSVLNPSLKGLEQAETVTAFSEEFAELGNPFVDVLRGAGLSTPITRATVRSVAASSPVLIEEALAYAGSSEALLAAAPSLEQVWGGRAYAASGWTGTGLAGTTALGRGVPTVVSYAENAFSVYVLSEHGALGGIAVLLLYMSLLVVVAFWIVGVKGRIHRTPAGLAGLALTVGSVLWLVLPAVYVAASNLGLLPLTGQNMPFLGLNSWADVVLVSGIGTGVFVTLAGLTGSECGEEVIDGGGGQHTVRSGRVLGSFVYALVGLSALALVVVGVGLVRQGDRTDRRQGLEYRTLLTAVDEILELEGGKAALRFDRFTVGTGRRAFEMDSLSVTEAGGSIPSLLPGGYLAAEVHRYNAFQRERAQIADTDPAGFEQLESYNPSLFRPYVRADGSLGVTRTASAWNRRVPSPFGERWAGDVRTGDAAVSWSLYNPEASVPLARRVRLTRRIDGRRRSCEFEPDGADTHAYCLSEARTPQVTLRGVAAGGGPQRLVSGWRSTRLDGERVAAGDSAALPAGSVLEVEPLGPAVFGRQWSGLLSTQQWINGRMRRRGEPRPPLDIVAALGRGPIDPNAPPESQANVELSLSEATTTELTQQLDAFIDGLPIPTEFATVVVARVSDGAVLAMAEVGKRSEPGRSRLLERVVPGSAVKPLLAAAVLTQRPELASLRIPARSGLVRQVGNAPRIPTTEAFRTALNCGRPESGRVNLENFLRCSNNEYAATLTLAGATLPGAAVDAVRAATDPGGRALEGRRVPRGTLLESALTEGMRTLFDVSTDPTITDSNRRSHAVWTGLAFSDGTPALAPFEALPDASRPSLLSGSDSEGTDLSLLYRYAFGAWENRWNVLDLATAFGRVTSDRRIQLTLAGNGSSRSSVEPEPVALGLGEFDWYEDFLSGLAGVGRNGTARGLSERWRRAGIPGTLFAKTGTLAEDEARRGSGLFIKSLLFAVGQTDEGPTTPLRCGLVGSVYFSFERGGNRGSLPSYQVEFAERRLARFLAEHWEDFGACPKEDQDRSGISAG